MPVNTHLKRLMIETIADNINEITLGFDGTPATANDGSAGRPALTLTPTIKILDNSNLLIEADIPTSYSFDESLKEVYLQIRGTDSFTPVTRHVFRPLLKTSNNEMKIQMILEVK